MVDGQASEGGAIACDDCTVEVTDCTFLGNSATDGGAIAVRTGMLSLDTTTFGGSEAGEENTALIAGGAVLIDASVATVLDSTFIGNQTAEMNPMTNSGGGAIDSFGDTDLMVDGSRFEANTAGRSGGAIRARTSACTISDSVFIENEARTTGGALHHEGQMLSVNGSEFDANEAPEAAAIDSDFETFELSDTVFVNHRGGTVLIFGQLGGVNSSAKIQRVSVIDSFLDRAALILNLPQSTVDFEDI
jgi:predicted outer membrane repeat protein